jgi:hypothetical protein
MKPTKPGTDTDASSSPGTGNEREGYSSTGTRYTPMRTPVSHENFLPGGLEIPPEIQAQIQGTRLIGQMFDAIKAEDRATYDRLWEEFLSLKRQKD